LRKYNISKGNRRVYSNVNVIFKGGDEVFVIDNKCKLLSILDNTNFTFSRIEEKC